MKKLLVVSAVLLVALTAYRFWPAPKQPSLGQYNTKTGRSHGMIIASATLDFPLSAATACDELTIAATGAVLGDPVYPGVPNVAMSANSDFSAFVSATDVVTIKHCAHGIAVNPASGTFKAVVFKE